MLSRGGYLCYSQIKIWQEKKMTNDIRTSFSKTEGSSNYTGKKNNGLQRAQVVILHWYLIPLSNCLKVALPDSAPAACWPRSGRPQGRRGKGLEGESRPTSSGCSSPPSLPKDFCHIYKYIHKYITYKGESGRQAPHRGSADTVTRLRNSRNGHGAPRTGLHVFSCPG